jgi:hypothetical protein
MESTSSRWTIQYKSDSITDVMRIEILAAISTAIDLHGKQKFAEMSKDIRNFCQNKY